MAPKVDVRIVIVVTITIISGIQVQMILVYLLENHANSTSMPQ